MFILFNITGALLDLFTFSDIRFSQTLYWMSPSNQPFSQIGNDLFGDLPLRMFKRQAKRTQFLVDSFAYHNQILNCRTNLCSMIFPFGNTRKITPAALYHRSSAKSQVLLVNSNPFSCNLALEI